MSSAAPDAHALAVAAEHLLAGKYFQLSAFVVLIYDHFLTFHEEVERIWKRQISGAAILFLINRYFTPLQFIIIIDAFHDPIWTPALSPLAQLNVIRASLTCLSHRCRRFVAFEGASTVAFVSVRPAILSTPKANNPKCPVVMVLRVFALYGRSIPILVFLLVLLLCQIVISSIGLSTGFAVELPPGFRVKQDFPVSTSAAASLWVTPLITNTVMFGLTLYRTRGYFVQSGLAPTLQIFLRDGVMYFLVIFVANLLNTLIYFLAPDDLKAIGASFSQLITSTMVSRLVLNLRSSSVLNMEEGATQPKTMHFMARTIGDLGEDMETKFDQNRFHEEEDIAMVKRNGQ
ncbi:hypothetical protein D9615_006187 [Tricholomella constricta]|uniref:DUF6533 domain-containing protein n=1 Tax=Tricholomella constricta TaxID=117010 RepID=A0A8H5HBC2_9AGAR|nr:hypothetical protein D9615_006187 [Tricholomella constricta]